MGRTCNQESFIQQGSHSNGRRDEELPRQAATKRICDLQTSSAKNIKGASVKVRGSQRNNPQKQGLNRYYDDTKFISFNSYSEHEWAK